LKGDTTLQNPFMEIKAFVKMTTNSILKETKGYAKKIPLALKNDAVYVCDIQNMFSTKYKNK